VRVVPTGLPGVLVVEPAVHRDARGFFLETYHAAKYAESGIALPFVQDNHSLSRRGTLRGLHAQRRHVQGKLVRCLRGAIFDVAVDIRRGSPHFGRWAGVQISGDDFRQAWIPPGFAHGFLVLSEEAEVEYKCTDLYHPEDEIAIAWNDPDVGVEWPTAEPVLSERDRAAPRLREIEHLLPRLDAAGGARP